MQTNWLEEDVSHQFDFYDDYLENRLGYQPLISDLINTLGSDVSVLDYGCGGGKVSRRLLNNGISKVTGVDISATMVAKASEHPERGSSSYQQVESGLLPFADGTFDAAVCCYVFINNNDKAELLKIAKEAFRTLKSGAVFYILDTNPDSIGIKFSSFKNGESGAVYGDGATRPVYLDLPDGNSFKIIDTHWEKQTYLEVLQQAGFNDVQVFEHREGEVSAADDSKVIGQNEQQWAPFVMFKSAKP